MLKWVTKYTWVARPGKVYVQDTLVVQLICIKGNH